ncbi:MAG: TonB-dependent receptor [Clostridium sp.]|nr:TonB-dependent receptor [Bacteroides sp.]MCM1199239.1 TonB-dependent receptor [Clostridium sp.]
MKQRFIERLCLVLLFLLPLQAFAQGTVTGTVKDSEGNPLAGVGVIYNGTETGTITDIDGHFSVKALKGKTLNFSFFGMEPQDVAIDGPEVLNIVMKEDRMQIEDAVVIGYGSLSRRDLTGSVSSVKADELVKTGSSNVFGALQGHVAGLNITSQSGEPGSGFNIKIRGNNSINAGTTPLFVIDGMQMDLSSGEIATTSTTGSGTLDPLSFLNPNDIESIEVLKDATATAIYGSRGANGVVIITTKSGATGTDRTIVNFDASVGISNVPKYIDMLDAQGYVDYRFYRRDYGWTGYGIDLNGDGISDDAPMDASGYEYRDWQKLLYRTAVTQNYNLSVNAIANKKTQLLATLGYLNQDGLVRNNDYIRYTGRLKFDHQINSSLKVGANVTYGRNISNGAVSSGGGSLGNSGLIQLIYLRRPIEVYTESDASEYLNGYTLLDCISGETYRKTVYSRIQGNAYLDWTITDGLDFRASVSGNTSNSKGMEFYTANSLWGYSKNGYAKIKTVDSFGYNASATLSYKKQWGKVHNFDAMIGAELSAYRIENLALGAYDFIDSSTGVFDISKGQVQEAPEENVAMNTRMSVFGRVSYNYMSRYYVSLNMRSDGSSKFMAGSRVGYFPSVSLAWRLSEEPFMANAKKYLDQFKIRLSAGASGNDRISDYAALALMTTNYYAVNGTEVMGMAPSSSANSKLKWETTYQYDLGLDVSLFGNRIDLSADIYYKDTRDMLYRATLPAQTGYTEQWQNLGRVDNRGIEVSLNTHNIQTRNFQWSTNITFDMSRNRVLDIGGIEYTSVNISNGVLSNDISRIMVGQPIGVGYGYVWDGNYQLDDFIATDKWGNEFEYPSDVVTSDNIDNFKYRLKDGVTSINSVAVQPGDRKYKDLDGNGEITADDRTVISDSNPKFTMGMGNTFTYKGFELTFFFEGVYGRDIMNEFKLRSESGQSGGTQFNNLRKDYWDGHWTPENPSNVYARLLNQTNTWVSSYYVEDGSFLRLRTLGLSYTFAGERLRKAKISSIKASVNAENLFVITRYSGMDPDVSTSNALFTGFDRMSYPKARTFTFGVSLSF